ncbi:DUF1054 family protein [Lactobacillus sp. CC-MHH1034]|uniref:DUF1054 family protein n=1 Tax=Agrilactobacillus fermenti TaxID=2586909 RepID=UPI001E3B7E52|nr:DUF1054 family protein [Agrilactobacillus fermenti]MCD2256470.1 DUF1054 family protein [Agrilactobacillus fermenti]
MITLDDFEIFQDPTLAGRLAKIKQTLDPKFEVIGSQFVDAFKLKTQRPFYLHIAKHLRRHKNPPPDTWLAISEGTRGYKMMPHFEIGLWPDKLFVWLALLSEVQQKAYYGQQLQKLQQSPNLFDSKLTLSKDHTQAEFLPLTPKNFTSVQQRFAKTKKGEFLIGHLIPKTDPMFQDKRQQEEFLKSELNRLLNIYESIIIR